MISRSLRLYHRLSERRRTRVNTTIGANLHCGLKCPDTNRPSRCVHVHTARWPRESDAGPERSEEHNYNPPAAIQTRRGSAKRRRRKRRRRKRRRRRRRTPPFISPRSIVAAAWNLPRVLEPACRGGARHRHELQANRRDQRSHAHTGERVGSWEEREREGEREPVCQCYSPGVDVETAGRERTTEKASDRTYFPGEWGNLRYGV